MKRIFTIIFVLACFALHAQTVKMEFRPEKGKEYTATTSTVQDMNIKVPAMGEMTTHTEQLYGVKLTLAEQVDNGYLMNVQLTQYSTKAESAGQSQNFSATGDDPICQAIAAALTKEFQAVVSPRGEVLEIRSLDDLYLAFEEPLSLFAKRKKDATIAQLKQLFSETVVKGIIQSGLTKFPDKELKVPAIWTEDTDSPELSAVITTQNRLTSVVDNQANIEAKIVVMQNPANKKTDSPQRMENLSGSGTAQLKVNAADGWIIEGNGEQTMAGDMVIEQSGQSQTFALTIKVISKITR